MALNIGTDDYSEYDPDYCDGHECVIDCSRCKYNAEHRDYYSEEETNLEMGFDPYLGCYTDDC